MEVAGFAVIVTIDDHKSYIMVRFHGGVASVESVESVGGVERKNAFSLRCH